jgi:hypothetical protein
MCQAVAWGPDLAIGWPMDRHPADTRQMATIDLVGLTIQSSTMVASP